MKNYYRVILGPKSIFAKECQAENYIGANYDIDIDLSDELTEDYRTFNVKFKKIWLEKNPTKSRIAAGLACGMLWTLSKEMKTGDIVICPDGQGSYFVGELNSPYSYHHHTNLPHRRGITWYPEMIERSALSQELRYSTGSTGTVANITHYAPELERLIRNIIPSSIVTADALIENPSVFALEKFLEEFLVSNWTQTELGKTYDIYEDEGALVGQQYRTDTGYVDILAVSKDKKTLLVVELKKGRASDSVVGQIQRYMGYVKEELAENNQEVKGIIIALEDDLRIRRALSVTNNIEFYRYQVSFKLLKN